MIQLHVLSPYIWAMPKYTDFSTVLYTYYSVQVLLEAISL